MTRRDFIRIAAALRKSRASPTVVFEMATALAGTNPRFDQPRFIRESGYPYLANAVIQPHSGVSVPARTQGGA